MRPRLLAAVPAAVLAAGAALLVLPIPAFEAPVRDPQLAREIAERGRQHFARIAAAKGLARPFPAPVERPENPTTPAKVELGRLLYFDPILSRDDDLSCAHCHHPDLGLADGRRRSMGVGGRGVGPERSGGAVLRRGAPTVWNAVFNRRQFWDGRARDLEEQAANPIQDPREMAEDAGELERQLRAIPEYVERFAAAFGAPAGRPHEAVTFEHVTFAVAAFERTLTSRRSAFDRYAAGDVAALTPAQRRGFNLFRSLKTRCFECHGLPTFANADFKVIGVPEAEDLAAPDLGRGEIEGGRAYDRAFKVPTLRNVALTAPYMHNGRFGTLEEVIDFYAAGGGAGAGLELPNLDDKIRPFDLRATEKADLIAFLHALTDESARPAIPRRVPSGLPAVPSLAASLAAGPGAASAATGAGPPSAAGAAGEGPARRVVRPGESIQRAIDAARPGDTVEVMPGVYHQSLTLDVSGIRLIGRRIDGELPVLDGRGVLADGIIGAASDLVIEGLVIRDFTANGVMINLAQNLVFRRLHLERTGLYGVYPVETIGVLIEGCTVTGARDAGLYVGQSKDVVVRGNRAYGNVTGIEIENSVGAVVEDNEVYDNAGGILVFALPDVPSKVSRRCRVVGNRVYDNNHPNFADPSAIVAAVPPGTGIMILAADDVEVAHNEIRGNRSFGVAVAGLDSFFGRGSVYDVDPYPDRNRIHGNRLSGNGTDPAAGIVAAGFAGADLLWDLSGDGNRWHQPGASRLPYALPAPGWSAARARANHRLWRLLAAWGG
ncbi:MAG: hypothetical protein D6696_05815 [Acidobacteria bacterium]|nr:MAG: hypothetical protein D6696_05815 [Acidobacteriota bacterium]